MSCGLGYVIENSFEFCWGIQSVVVEDGNFCDRNNLATLLEKNWNSNVLGELQQGV
jgi:hypothetical protein